MDDEQTETQDFVARFHGLGVFGESDADRLGRWRATFHRLRDALAEPPADDDLDMMIQRLAQVEASRICGE